MDGFLKKATPAVLILLGLFSWFETFLLGKEVGLTRFVLGVLCIYTAMLVVERQRMEARFAEVLGTFKDFYTQRKEAQKGADAEKGLEAVGILIAALDSPDEGVRQSAEENLKRLTGKDFGRDVNAWSAWLAGARAETRAATSGGTPAAD